MNKQRLSRAELRRLDPYFNQLGVKGLSSVLCYRLAITVLNTARSLLPFENQKPLTHSRKRLTDAEKKQLDFVCDNYGIKYNAVSRNKQLAIALADDLDTLENGDEALAWFIWRSKLTPIRMTSNNRQIKDIQALGAYEFVEHVVTQFNLSPLAACRYLVSNGIPLEDSVDPKLRNLLISSFDSLKSSKNHALSLLQLYKTEKHFKHPYAKDDKHKKENLYTVEGLIDKDELRNEISRRILDALKAGEKTQREMNQLAGGHVTQPMIRQRLAELHHTGMVVKEEPASGKHKYAIRWSLTEGKSSERKIIVKKSN